VVQVNKNGEPQIKRTALKDCIESTLLTGIKAAAGGQRIRFSLLGILSRKEVQARKAGKGVNPFTKEPMIVKARPATKKPRWTFPKAIKETFVNKKNW